jgi:hypothetical protein
MGSSRVVRIPEWDVGGWRGAKQIQGLPSPTGLILAVLPPGTSIKTLGSLQELSLKERSLSSADPA